MKEIWEVREVGAKGDLAIAVKGSPASAGRIATVPHYEGREGRQMMLASLICAAPDLFVTLSQWLERYEYGEITGDLIDRTFAALKKVRGEDFEPDTEN